MSPPISQNQHACAQLLDGLNSAVLLFDAQLILKYINGAGEMLLECSTQRVVNQHAAALLQEHSIIDSLQEASLNGEQVARRGLTLNLTYGHPVTVDLIITPTVDPHGVTGIIVEMTQIDRQLRISREEGLLAQSSASRALVRGLAHEIKNPLGGLRGAAQLLERELHNEELKEYTQIIISEADRLQKLIDQMLGPNTPPQRRMINIHEATERVRQIVQAQIPTHITITRNYDPSIPEIYADLDQVIQALLNLVRNASQAVEQGGEITLRTRTMRRFTIGTVVHRLVARIDVIDNGPGIDASMSESIFLPMITGRAEGTGLGLPIAQSLINLNGGLIEWESRPGETQFTILLPIDAPPQTEYPQ